MIVSGIKRPPHTVSTLHMNEPRFDSLVRTLSARVSRKRALKMISGVVALAVPSYFQDLPRPAGARGSVVSERAAPTCPGASAGAPSSAAQQTNLPVVSSVKQVAR